ncbi:cytochrome c [Ekhidna sp. MALMAid0563]|uniref:c-type cytochrome n=1 Tax=Ekhidna sp. MALMAid0563 TaxID=3143937 RepID=UPI0032DEB03E
MKSVFSITLIAALFIITACGGGDGKSKIDQIKEQAKMEPVEQVPASERVTLDNKGVGKIKDLPLPETIDQEMVERGKALFSTNCSACHKIDKRFIGPSPKGIMKRRSPEWIMNMILDPQLMVEQDRCAKDLLVEFNGAAMANQNMTEEQARDILEYFRTL